MRCCKFYVVNSNSSDLVEGYIIPKIDEYKFLYLTKGYTIELYQKTDKNGCIALLRCNNGIFIHILANAIQYHTYCDDDFDRTEYKPIAGGSNGKPIRRTREILDN